MDAGPAELAARPRGKDAGSATPRRARRRRTLQLLSLDTLFDFLEAGVIENAFDTLSRLMTTHQWAQWR